MTHVFDTSFALRLAINLVVWIAFSIFFFNILPRYVPRYARWLGVRFPLGFAVFICFFGALLYTLITMFLASIG